jgi:hypothetical protein
MVYCTLSGNIIRIQVNMAQPKLTVEQLANETMQDYIKFNVFVKLGSNRTLSKAFEAFYETTNQVSQLWRDLAVKNNWDARASEYDKASQTVKR